MSTWIVVAFLAGWWGGTLAAMAVFAYFDYKNVRKA